MSHREEAVEMFTGQTGGTMFLSSPLGFCGEGGLGLFTAPVTRLRLSRKRWRDE